MLTLDDIVTWAIVVFNGGWAIGIVASMLIPRHQSSILTPPKRRRGVS
jgi:hypothetical protein